MIKGDEVRHGKYIYLDAVSKDIIDSLSDNLLTDNILYHLNNGSTAISPMNAKEVLESYKESGELVFSLRLRTDETCIGTCRLGNIDWKSRHAQLFIGIISEAHLTLDMLVDIIQTTLQFVYWEANLNRIYIHCVEDDTLLPEALEQTRFSNEGYFRQEVYRNGCYLDKVIYSILQREWSN